ncbi:hypothetical protein PTKIN_Ptkin12aG0139800 [Pterospermum kingtungense]
MVMKCSKCELDTPNDAHYKVNLNGALNAREKVGGIGVVVRNATGDVMGALASPYVGVSDPLLIEAFAAVKALEFAWDIWVFIRYILKRKGNEAAHRLARFGLGLMQELVWVEGYPQIIHDVIHADVRQVS